MEVLGDNGERVELEHGKWLLYPTVSVGNVPQLAVDLIVNSLTVSRSAHVRDPDAVPVCGDGSPLSVLSTGCDLCELASNGYAMLPRAPPAPGRAASTAGNLVDLVADNSLSTMFVLTTAYAGGRRDSQLRDSTKFRYMLTSAAEPMRARLESLKIPVLEGSGDKGWWPYSEDSSTDAVLGGNGEVVGENTPAFVASRRRTSLLRTLLDRCEQKNICLVVLLMFVFEGDNTQDALEMATATARLVELSQGDSAPTWKIPRSWEPSFGPSEDIPLY